MKTLQEALQRLFAAYPELCGFALEDDDELHLGHLALEPGYHESLAAFG